MSAKTRCARPVRTLTLITLSLSLLGADWPRFRGPQGSGTSDARNLPVRWSDDEGIAWKTPLPGPGSSSPVLAGSRVFLTCYSGYGTDRRDPGEIDDLRLHVVCVDATSGKVLWDHEVHPTLPEEPYRGIGIPNHGYASSTPVTDGERVYAFFGRSGVVACDLEGEELWRSPVAPDPSTNGFGTASSPILFEDLLIVAAGIESEEIVAFDKRSGEEAWRSPATGYGSFWGTPILVDVEDRSELVLSVPGEVWGLNPENGKLRWYATSADERNVCTSPVAADGVVYVIPGRGGGALAVRPGGRGDVSESHVAWRSGHSSYVPSPVVHDGHLYWVNDQGIATCADADSGEEVFRERLPDAGSIYASVLVADGKIYCVTRRNGTFVLAAEPKFRMLAHDEIASDESDFNASPAPANGGLYLRSDRFLYAIEGES